MIFRRIRSSKLVQVYFGFITIWAVNVSVIFRSSWAGDDWPISQTPYWIQWRYGALTNWNIWTEALFWNDQWMKGAGRFYPLTWIESRFVFSYLRELWQYKLYQVAMLFFAGILLIVVCYLFTRSHLFTVMVLLSLSLTIQFRRDFDPHLAFAVMLPSLLIKIFLALIALYYASKTKKLMVGVFLGIISGILYFAAMSTYEFSFLLFPLFVIAYLFGISIDTVRHERKSFYLSWLVSLRFLPVIISWLSYGYYVFGYLRPRASAISGSYVLGISWSSIEVFISQAFMGLPLISLRNMDLSFSAFSLTIGFVLIYICRMSFKSLLRDKNGLESFINKEDSQNWQHKRNTILLLFFAFSMILSPGFMMALQPTWWNRADIQHTYLGVMITEFGTAILIATLLEILVKKQLRFRNTAKKKL